MKIFLSILLALVLGACTKVKTPECPYKLSKGETKITANAGCFIKYKDKVLVIKKSSNGKLSFPGGRSEKDEIVQCTAFRETFEETGLKAKIGKLLYNDKGKFYLFKCSIEEELNYERLIVLRLQDHDKREIKNILLVDINKITADKWFYAQDVRHFKKFLK